MYSPDNWDDQSPTNGAPILANGDVDPQSGLPDIEYTYSIHYQDPDNDPPSISKVVIDGFEYNMNPLGSTYQDGVDFEYKTNLLPGDHVYNFIFSDGNISTRFPDVGNNTGPFVIQFNSPPELLPGGILNDTYFSSVSFL